MPAELEIEVYHDAIQEKLAEDNSFLSAVSEVGQRNILQGKIVHIPQAGEPSKVSKNRTEFPATIGKRVDKQVLYAIDTYYTNPVWVELKETQELSYDKIRSVLDVDLLNLSEEVANGMLLNFVQSPTGDDNTIPSNNILTVSGEKDLPATAAGTTGTRKNVTLGDLQRMQNLMRAQKAWTEDNMYALLPAEMVAQLFPADSQLTATYMAATSETERRAGIIYKVQGWNIMIRSSVYLLQADGQVKVPGALATATDNEGALFWNKNMVEKAIGITEVFSRERDPQFYGDIFSFTVRCGGRARRKNFEGVAILAQKA